MILWSVRISTRDWQQVVSSDGPARVWVICAGPKGDRQRQSGGPVNPETLKSGVFEAAAWLWFSRGLGPTASILANAACLGGHVSVWERAFRFWPLSRSIRPAASGGWCMVSGSPEVNMDCLPFTMVTQAPAPVVGLNRVGLKRAAWTPTPSRNQARLPALRRNSVPETAQGVG